ncbi:MAG TPA: hypothetical protein PKM12_07400 [Marmoricola sp.]|nr:hypothetical protein [Marmoricola sp.]
MRCAVLGSPIAHSLSPALHRAAYRSLGLDWTYEAIEVDSASLTGFVEGLGEQWRGLSLTMPLKRTVLPLLTEQDLWVTRSGAANTVILEDGQRRGFNTDIPGAMAALKERSVQPNVVTIIGAALHERPTSMSRDVPSSPRKRSREHETKSPSLLQ